MFNILRKYLIFIILLLNNLIILSQEQDTETISLNIDSLRVDLYKESHAILVGVSDYFGNWPELPGVQKDIEKLKPVLESHGFNVIVIENPIKDELDKAITDFIGKFGQESHNRLLFYFAGHGHTLTTNYGEELGYFVPADAPNPSVDLVGFKSKAVPMSLIEIYAKQIDSKHALFLFDACFSGSIFSMTRAIPDAISYKTTKPVRQFITSGSANELVPDESIFRREFITAITSDNADANKDGYLTGSELGEYLQTNVTNYSFNSQHPQYGKIRNPYLDKGDYVFVLKNNKDVEITYEAKVPKIVRTSNFNNYLFHGIYLRMNAGGSNSSYHVKFSLYYSSKLLHHRYCIGLEGNLLRTLYIQEIETFPNLFHENKNELFYTSINLYNRVFLFPQNQSFINPYLGASISYNDWQVEVGLRPFLTKKLMFEVQANYLIHNGEVKEFNFNPFGNAEYIEKMHLFNHLNFGFNIVYFISFV